ncbi:ATP-binding protein [Actinocatenispora sera]|uniref:sensor histidine kinase n=1 Tax=Actinocatenispora sera TaxID=390989 RepID=UPI0033F77FC9
MDWAALGVGGLAGLLVGGLGMLAALRGRHDRTRRAEPGQTPSIRPAAPDQEAATPPARADRRAHAALVEQSVAALRVGLVVLGCDGEVILTNPAARRLGLVRVQSTGLTPHSVLRTLGCRITRPGQQRDVDLELHRRDLPGAATDGPDRLGVRVHLVGLAGGYVAMEAEDVTEAHRVARVRRDFVANVSHELKTPVGALQLLGEALVDALDDPEASRRFAERIAHESSRLGRLITELLELSRLQGAEPLPDPVPVDADRLVAEVLDRTRTTAQAKQISVVAEGERGHTVYGNETQLATALANLVENAVAYSPERTIVTVRTGHRAETVLLSVIDQGIGIEPRDLDRIFERFYRADKARSRATGGTGLGLAIVKHIATNHGGRVDVASTVGIGSTFTLRLPGRPPADIAVEHNPGEIAEDIGQVEVQPGAPARRA